MWIKVENPDPTKRIKLMIKMEQQMQLENRDQNSFQILLANGSYILSVLFLRQIRHMN